MALVERTREFGVLLAIGVSPGRLCRLLLMESAFLTFVGMTLGVILGCLVTWYFQKTGIEISGTEEIYQKFGIPSRLYPALSWLSISLGPAMVLITTMGAALYPALRVRKLKPVQAMASA